MIKATDKPLVSIITPFFNTEKYFRECIESVLSQEYNNWELLLVDDGSTDGSTSIAMEYAAKFPGKIIYLQHENHGNRGASASRNLGIQFSKGELIAFLDSDDVYLPSKLKDQVRILNLQPKAGMLYSSTEYWYSWRGLSQNQKKDRVWSDFGVEANTLVAAPELLMKFLTTPQTVPCMGSILVRREAILSVGSWEKSYTHVYEDQVFLSKICLKWPVYVAEGCWDRYRQHPNSSYQKIRKNRNDAFNARRRFLRWIETYLIENGATENRALWRAFKKAYRPYKYRYLHTAQQYIKKMKTYFK